MLPLESPRSRSSANAASVPAAAWWSGLAFALLAAALTPAAAATPPPIAQQPVGWDAVARSLIPAGEADQVWDRCDADGTTAIAGVPYLGGTAHCRFILVDGTPRRFVVYTPKTFLLAQPPVVLMFHGSSQHGEHFLLESTWRTLADQHGFVVAFPTGLQYQVLDPDTGNVRQQTKWHSYHLEDVLDPAQPDWRPPQFSPLSPWPADDVKFTQAIIDDLAAQMPIDRCRIFVSGFSNGGGFVGRLAVDMPQVLAAGGAVTSLYQEVFTPSQSIPLFFAQGALDEHLLDGIESGGAPRPTQQDMLDPATLFGYQAVIDRMDDSTQTLGLVKFVNFTAHSAAPRTWLQRTWPLARAGTAGRPWLQWKIWRGVNHKYPRGVLNPLGADNPYDFDAAVEFWDFFSNRPRTFCPSIAPNPQPADGAGR